MISTYKLTEMYNKWGDEQNLQPLGCALEEVMGNDKLSETQRNWLVRFIDVWEYAQDKEDLLSGDQIALKGGDWLFILTWIGKLLYGDKYDELMKKTNKTSRRR